MEIKPFETTVGAVSSGFVDNDEEGVFCYDGKLNIRPKYQRNFVYNEKQQAAVIDTIFKGFPLNVMYWVDEGDGTFGILDGQQRTLSFCKYRHNGFSVMVNGYTKTFENLTPDEKQRFLDYKLMIYICKGTDSEKLSWFRIINIAGQELTEQELRNAAYTGPWLDSAKQYFSKTNCVASLLSKDYVNVRVNRQELLELAIKWISKDEVENYMAAHQHDPNAIQLWTYFKNVIDWVKEVFPHLRPKEMKGVDWGPLYDEFHEKIYDTKALEDEISALILDRDVTNKSGVYPYVLTRNEKWLNIREFDIQDKLEAYERQHHQCPMCLKEGNTHQYLLEEMEADHKKPWSKGGKTEAKNCQMLCQKHNREKGGK